MNTLITNLQDQVLHHSNSLDILENRAEEHFKIIVEENKTQQQEQQEQQESSTTLPQQDVSLLLQRLNAITQELPRLENERRLINLRKSNITSELRNMSILNRDLLQSIEQKCDLETALSNFKRATTKTQMSLQQQHHQQQQQNFGKRKNSSKKTVQSSEMKRKNPLVIIKRIGSNPLQITQEQLDNVSTTVRGRATLLETNTVLSSLDKQLNLHSIMTISKLSKHCKISGLSGKCILNILRNMNIIQISKQEVSLVPELRKKKKGKRSIKRTQNTKKNELR